MRHQVTDAELWGLHTEELEKLNPHEEHLFVWKGRAYIVYPADTKDVERIAAGVVMD